MRQPAAAPPLDAALPHKTSTHIVHTRLIARAPEQRIGQFGLGQPGPVRHQRRDPFRNRHRPIRSMRPGRAPPKKKRPEGAGCNGWPALWGGGARRRIHQWRSAERTAQEESTMNLIERIALAT